MHVMRTNIVIDEELMAEAMKVGPHKTKKDAVEAATDPDLAVTLTQHGRGLRTQGANVRNAVAMLVATCRVERLRGLHAWTQ